MKVRYFADAEEELLAAVSWYENCVPGLGAEFYAEVLTTERQIAETPKRWAEIEPGIRKLNTDRFPYGLIYRVRDDAVEIIAVMHLHRRPRYWRPRIRRMRDGE